jgi:uncharacterized iron-regulated membrane protein
MEIKKLHRLVGIAVAAPILLWALTGIVFLIKPGFDGAYERLSPRHYEMQDTVSLLPSRGWSEITLFRTVLGDHLIVRDRGVWRHLDPGTLEERAFPSEQELKALISDAIKSDSGRYGNIVKVESGKASTDTGVEITLDWSGMKLVQRGSDTRLIDTLYKIHYLQWVGDPSANKALGFLGILLLIALFFSGLSLYFSRRKI